MASNESTILTKNIYTRIYFIFLLIAFFLTIGLIIWKNGLIKPEQVTLKKISVFSSTDKVQDYFNDFDHDGISEKVRFIDQKSQGEIAVIFYNSKGKLMDQWNFSERWISGAVYFTDYDADQFDECYFFTMVNDSLFFYAFDPRKPDQFLFYRKFIVSAPQPNPHPRKVWDLRKPEVVFFDADSDKHKECFINLWAGISLQPRVLFRFDIDQQKITARSPRFGALIKSPRLIDLNNDGTPEILMALSRAPNHFHNDIPFKDDHSYLMVFDKDLHFYFEPKRFNYFGSRTIHTPYIINNKPFIFTSYQYNGPMDINPQIFLFDHKGHELRRKIFPQGLSLFPIIIIQNNHEQLYLWVNKSNLILKPNFNLEIVQKINLEQSLSKILIQKDLDGDFEKEIIAVNQAGNYLIISSQFKNCYELPVKAHQNDFLNFERRANQEDHLVIQSRGHQYYFSFTHNPFYEFRYFIFIALFFSIYFLGVIIFLLWQKLFATITVYKNLFQYAQTGLCIINHKAKVKYLNGNFEHHLHIAKHVDKNMHFFDAFEERPEVVSFIKQLISSKKFIEKEIVIRADEESTPVLLLGTVLPGIFKIPAGFLIKSIHQSAKANKQKLEMWTRTVQKMAHDIKTPLATVQLLAQSIKMRLDKNPQLKDQATLQDLQKIDRVLSKIREMTKHFLRYTNLEKPNFQWISIKKILDNALQKFSYYTADGITVKTDIDEEHDLIWVDGALLEMVLQIIIENAIDSTQNQGTIFISTSMVEIFEENFKPYLEIEIIDNGPGIPKEYIDQIFDPFFTTKDNGTGMGLTLAKKIIEDHHGKIEISSDPGHATQVKILIPYKEKPTNQSKESSN